MRNSHPLLILAVPLALMTGAGSVWAEYSGPDWYEIRTGSKSSLVAKVMRSDDTSYACLYQGMMLSIPRDDVSSIRPIWEVGRIDGLPHELDREECREVLDAIEDLAEPDHRVRREAVRLLTEAFPESRPFVQHATRHKKRRVRMLSTRLLGEHGDFTLDGTVILDRLGDHKPKVRLLAILAIRKLGHQGVSTSTIDRILRYLDTETELNNKKMAVKALHYWKAEEAIKPLIRMVALEKDRGLRGFLHRALLHITGDTSIQDPTQWTLEYGENSELLNRARGGLQLPNPTTP